ncbi:hypothetical protein OEA41_010151 [Lepraria neglecta]|uniref:PD-(D/E)XK nuclease-like domain-containing protein n=1 Tax=Lepraria neglecta TaxID=209136 RepID=A0AAD9YW05_9LECA|nr:hypothetical protein OEA41_010151 [Lepraria neglecta]
MLLSKHPRSPSNSSRSSDSINIWLDQHPAKPAEYISSDSQAPYPSPHLRKRRKLEEIDPPNSISQYQTRSQQSSPEDKSGAPRRQSPRRSRQSSPEDKGGTRRQPPGLVAPTPIAASPAPAVPVLESRAEGAEDSDSLSIYAASSVSLFLNAPKLDPPGGDDTSYVSYGDPRRTESDTRSCISSKGSKAPGRSDSPTRPPSPTKLTYLFLKYFEIAPMQLDDRDAELSHDVEGVVLRLLDIGKGHAVIPRQMRKGMQFSTIYTPIVEDNYMEATPDEKQWDRGAELARFEAGPPQWSGPEVAEEVFWHRAKEVLEHTKRALRKFGFGGSEWSARVIVQVFDIALSGYWQRQGIHFKDVTTVSTELSRRLTPMNPKATKITQKVDFCCYLRATDHQTGVGDKILAKIGKKCRELRTTANERSEPANSSLHHLTTGLTQSYETVLAIFFEVKPDANLNEKQDLQLGFWAIALFARFQTLTSENQQMPTLPLIKVQASRWSFSMADLLPRETGATTRKVRILDCGVLGDTKTMLGIFQIIAALKELANYMAEVYLPWIEKVLLAGV